MTRKDQIEAMLAHDPEDSFLRYGLAMEHVSAKDDAAAMREFRELLKRDAGYVPAYLQAGQALIRLGEEDEAKEMLKAGIEAARRAGHPHPAGEMEGIQATQYPG
ncbi:MAG: tetratricopeptide repeat protein, partial [Gemmataceae bacterium]|nr:tetratricopeptide repeat protein [Gemmataceae bacterium]